MILLWVMWKPQWPPVGLVLFFWRNSEDSAWQCGGWIRRRRGVCYLSDRPDWERGMCRRTERATSSGEASKICDRIPTSSGIASKIRDQNSRRNWKVSKLILKGCYCKDGRRRSGRVQKRSGREQTRSGREQTRSGREQTRSSREQKRYDRLGRDDNRERERRTQEEVVLGNTTWSNNMSGHRTDSVNDEDHPFNRFLHDFPFRRGSEEEHLREWLHEPTVVAAQPCLLCQEGFEHRDDLIAHVEAVHGGHQRYRNACFSLESVCPHVVTAQEVRVSMWWCIIRCIFFILWLFFLLVLYSVWILCYLLFFLCTGEALCE